MTDGEPTGWVFDPEGKECLPCAAEGKYAVCVIRFEIGTPVGPIPVRLCGAHHDLLIEELRAAKRHRLGLVVPAVKPRERRLRTVPNA